MTTPRACILVTLAACGLCAACTMQRPPAVNINPTYSIMRDAVALETHMGGDNGRVGLATADVPDSPPPWEP